MRTFELALITGASSGIGEAVARLLADQGINLIIHGRNVKKLEELKRELPVQVEIVVADLATESEKVVEKIKSAVPDLVINNAGFGLYGEAIEHETQAQLKIIHVNVDAVVEITLESAKAMIAKKKKGVIMNISSSAAFQMFPTAAVYAASKAFLNNFTESFDDEISPYGLRCLASCPGVVSTQFSTRAAGKEIKPPPFSMNPEFAAEQIWWQIQKGKTIHAFDWKYRVGTFLSSIAPRRLISLILRNTISRRR